MFEAFVLGIVQGLTEFLPVSSSGHLVLFGRLLGKELGGSLEFVVAVHLGTLVAVCLVFRRSMADVIGELPTLFRPSEWKGARERGSFRLAIGIILVTAVTGFFGFLFRGFIESAFQSLLSVGVAFFCVGGFLFGTRFANRKRMGIFPLGILVGLAQSVALMPGVSRSGTTIGTALFAGQDREFAARLSFLAAIPAIVGAAALEFFGGHGGTVDVGVLVVGFLSALVSGLFALRILLGLIKAGRFYIFSYYLWAIGVGTVVLALLSD